jgi:hypothetical protein
MKRILVAALLASSASAFAEPIGYPGSTWGVLIFPTSITPETKDGKEVTDNVLLQGKVEQGIDWFRFGDDKWKLNTFASFNYTIDNAGLTYNNKLVPAVGVKVVRAFKDGVLDLGIQGVYEQRLRPAAGEKKNATGVQVYASWWFGWNLK